MLKKPTNEELTELKRLSGNRVIKDYLQSALDDTKDSLVGTSDIDKVRVLQGSALTLADILKFISL